MQNRTDLLILEPKRLDLLSTFKISRSQAGHPSLHKFEEVDITLRVGHEEMHHPTPAHARQDLVNVSGCLGLLLMMVVVVVVVAAGGWRGGGVRRRRGG